MAKFRLRTKFLLSLLLVSSGLTCATLLVVRRSVRLQLRREIGEDLRSSLITFQDFQRQREVSLSRSAELLASLPSLKALMTTQDPATIQDASADIWRLAASDLFVLANRRGDVVAIHTAAPAITHSVAQELLQRSLQQDAPAYWWFGENHLYQVFLQPIYFGPPANNSTLGLLAVGHEIDDRVARDIGRIAGSEVAFRYGNLVVVSTLSPSQRSELAGQIQASAGRAPQEPEEIELGGERYLAASVELAPGAVPPVHLSVLKSFDQMTAFLDNLNRLLLGLGLVAVLAGSLLVFVISDAFTRPLADLVSGVRALEKGDFTYPLAARSQDEAAELTRAFDRMRGSLKKTQQQLLEAERLVTIGRMASSISHDLRHPLTAIVANAEFLCESDLNTRQREELYQEIRVAVDQLTDLVDSLLEFSRAREQLRLVRGNVEEIIQRAIQVVRARPEFRQVEVKLSCEGRGEGWFDPKKLERVFLNLLLNACEAVPPDSGRVEIEVREGQGQLEIRIADNGPGIPEPIRGKLFQPFVSYGKEDGVGLGLTVAQKISQDHGGDVSLESTSPGRTVFKLVFPMSASVDRVSAD